MILEAAGQEDLDQEAAYGEPLVATASACAKALMAAATESVDVAVEMVSCRKAACVIRAVQRRIEKHLPHYRCSALL